MSWLYAVTIYPLQIIYLAVYTLFVVLTGDYAASLFLLSFASAALMVPLEKLAASFQADEQKIQAVMTPQIERIKAESSGAERQRRIAWLYRRYAYNPLYSVRSAAGVAVQIPFLIGAYYMLASLPELAEQKFFGLFPLGEPDCLMVGINLLPLLMTALNLSAAYAAPDLSRRDRWQATAIAVLFLVMLYNAPSALMVYWTTNNAISLFRALVKKYNISFVPDTIGEKLREIFGSVHFLAAFVFSAELMIFAPLVSYFANVNEFSYSPEVLLNTILRPWVLLFLFMDTVLFAASRLKKLTVQGKKELIGYLEIIGAACAICVLLEGTILGYGLPPLDGTPNLFSSKPRLIGDSLVWLGVIGFFLWKRKAVAANYRTILLCITIFVIALGIAEYANKAETFNRNEVASNGLAHYNGDEILRSIKYHSADNIIILLWDNMDTFTFEKALELTPEYKRIFDNFTLYQNNLGTASQTGHAVPQIMAGRIFDKTTYVNFVNEVSTGDESIAGSSVLNGRNVYMASLVSPFNVSNAEINSDPISAKRNKIEIKTLHFFRFFPYIIKRKWEYKVNFKQGASDSLTYRDKDKFTLLESGLAFKSDKPVTIFTHFFGAHVPYILDCYGNAIERGTAKNKKLQWEDMDLNINGTYVNNFDSYKARLSVTTSLIKRTGEYIAALKKANLYDSSTIFIISDHGDRAIYKDSIFDAEIVRKNPLNMVKYAYADYPFTVNTAPISSHNIRHLVELAYQGNEHLSERAEEYVSTLSETREYYCDNDDTIITFYGTDRNHLIETDRRQRSDGEEKVEELKIDRLYTFGLGDHNLPQAKPQGEHKFPRRIFGLYFPTSDPSAEFYLQFDKTLKNKPVSMEISYWLLSSTNAAGKISIEDMTSGNVQKYNVIAKGEQLQSLVFDNALIDDKGRLRLSVNCESNADVAFTNIILHQKSSQTNKLPK